MRLRVGAVGHMASGVAGEGTCTKATYLSYQAEGVKPSEDWVPRLR